MRPSEAIFPACYSMQSMHEILRRERHSLFLPERCLRLIFFDLHVATPASLFMASTTPKWGFELCCHMQGAERECCETCPS